VEQELRAARRALGEARAQRGRVGRELAQQARRGALLGQEVAALDARAEAAARQLLAAQERLEGVRQARRRAEASVHALRLDAFAFLKGLQREGGQGQSLEQLIFGGIRSPSLNISFHLEYFVQFENFFSFCTFWQGQDPYQFISV
jgi:chromosome segregation ATPase